MIFFLFFFYNSHAGVHRQSKGARQIRIMELTIYCQIAQGRTRSSLHFDVVGFEQKQNRIQCVASDLSHIFIYSYENPASVGSSLMTRVANTFFGDFCKGEGCRALQVDVI